MPKKMYVVFCEDYGTYWCGLNTWDNQLRKAKVFYSLKYANEVHDRFKELKLKNVEIRMELVPENPTNADRIRAMSDEELAASHLIIPCFYDDDGYGECKYGWHDRKQTCEECKLEWLKQPAKEGTDHE